MMRSKKSRTLKTFILIIRSKISEGNVINFKMNLNQSLPSSQRRGKHPLNDSKNFLSQKKITHFWSPNTLIY